MSPDYAKVLRLLDAGQFEAAWKIVGNVLNDNPMDVQALTTGSFILLKLGALPQAYHFGRIASQLAPKDDAAWTNYGHAASQMWLTDEAERAYKKGLEVAKEPEHKRVLLQNIAALYVDDGRFDEAEVWVKRLLAEEPGRKNALANLGFCQLAKRDWVNGWKNYRLTIGAQWRKRVQYRDEELWDGTPGKTVVLYGEQGLGDEISFASVIPDVSLICRKIILDCDPRLKNLFKRSFPEIKVYGTKLSKGGMQWDREDWDFDVSLPLGQACEYVRNADSEFPGTPYLTPCPERTAMWKAHFAGKRAVGVAWTGGVPRTNERNRKLDLEALLPLFHGVNARFVCLQYRDASDEIAAFRAKHPEVDLVQFPWATLTSDYDDTAALVASLDHVVCIQTAIAHTAGALGVPVSVLVPRATQWRYGCSGDVIPWYSSLRVIRQEKHGHWQREIDRALSHLRGLQSPAATPARDHGLRNGLDTVRPLGLADHRANGSLASA